MTINTKIDGVVHKLQTASYGVRTHAHISEVEIFIEILSLPP